jgi:excinuclease ABC subunit B
LHSDIKALERIELLRDLRLGVFDVLVGVNLLREGLDLPEVTLVAIMEADKEGFLRAARSLIQTIGRAARNVDGKVILYADKITDSMATAMNETSRRRDIQIAHNTAYGITPTTIVKEMGNQILESLRGKESSGDEKMRVASGRSRKGADKAAQADMIELSERDIRAAIKKVEKDMKDAARALDFELAAELRDQLKVLHERAAQMRKSS